MLYTHGDPPLHRCRSCDASTAEIQRLRDIIAAQDRRIIRMQAADAELRAQMHAAFTRIQESIATFQGQP